MKIELSKLTRKAHALWLAILVDGSLQRFRMEKFSFFTLRWATARGVIKWFPPALEGYLFPDKNGSAIRCARDLSSNCHQHDTEQGVFGSDCRLMYSIGISLEQLIDCPSAKVGEDHVEELMEFADEVAPFSSPNYHSLLRAAFDKLNTQSDPLPEVCLWLSMNLKDPKLKLIANRASDS